MLRQKASGDENVIYAFELARARKPKALCAFRRGVELQPLVFMPTSFFDATFRMTILQPLLHKAGGQYARIEHEDRRPDTLAQA
jgi:hypothetical protein